MRHLVAAEDLMGFGAGFLSLRGKGYFRGRAFVACILSFGLVARAGADVSQGSAERAKKYYRSLATSLDLSTPDAIFDTTLDNLASYLGYDGITGADLYDLPSETLMNPVELLRPCVGDRASCRNALRNRDRLVAALGPRPIRSDDILVTRFFAPKIMNIKDPEATRKLGWRKLVRIKTRPGSVAAAHDIGAAIILFNVFTDPGVQPFSLGDESVNTQVMLLSVASKIMPSGKGGPPTVYWLDYDRPSAGGKLHLSLDASFDANELPAVKNGVRSYFVPDGCVACHGNNERRSMVNYLDTDHWFDRLSSDFTAMKDQALLLDGGSDASTPEFQAAFDVIRRFNEEADAQARQAQRQHDEVLAAQKWLELHATSVQHAAPVDRAIGPTPRWSREASANTQLEALNQYCFRCHGTVKFSVFNRSGLFERRALVRSRLKPDAPLGLRMPPDRDLPEEIRKLLLTFGRGGH